MTETIRILAPSDLDAAIETFQRAFADYVVDLSLTREQLLEMMERRGADLTCSVGVFEEDAMVAVMVVAVDDFEGITSAYDVFTGVVPRARGRGLARRMFEVAVPVVARRGARRFVLEVITKNEAAVRSYRRAGFEERRRLRVFAFEAIETPATNVERLSIDEALRARPLAAAAPTWQNSDASILRIADRVIALGVREDGQVVGVAFVVPSSRDVPQIHVDPARSKVLLALLGAARALNEGDGPLRVINVDARRRDFADALAAIATAEYPPQFEMLRAIDPTEAPA